MKPAPWVRSVLDTLLPPGCVGCGQRIPPERGPTLVCPRCRSRIHGATWPRCSRCHAPRGTGRSPGSPCRECAGWPDVLVAARHAALLEAPADALVHGLKYGGWREVAGEMGSSMAAVDLPDLDGRSLVVVPVPTTARRRKARGYNQAELLARVFASARGLPLLNALERRKGGPTQVALHPSRRMDNVRGAFTVRPAMELRIRDAHVILIDDVLTTGSTASAVAKTLARIEVAGVTLVTYARALPFRHS